MFDLTTSPEFLAWLEKAMFAAAARAGIAGPGQGIDPENEWLTAREAMAFLRLKETAFKGFREREKLKLVISTGVNATEVRYQLASLQRIMRDNAVGLPEPEPLPTFARQAHANGHANGKRPRSSATAAAEHQNGPTLFSIK